MDRALLFRAGPLTIDLILQGQEDTDAFVCGQVVDEVTSEPLAGVQIWLGDDGQPLQTDAFGQFRMTESIDETRPSHLRVKTPRGELTCAIPAVA